MPDQSKAEVLKKYPQAESKYNPPVTGAVLPHDHDGHWAIYQGRALGYRRLGLGNTESNAWADAAAELKKESN